MKCDLFDNRLDHVLDQRLDPSCDQFLRRHAEECERCSKLLDLQQLWQQTLDSKRHKVAAAGIDCQDSNIWNVKRTAKSSGPAWGLIVVAMFLVLVPIGVVSSYVMNRSSVSPARQANDDKNGVLQVVPPPVVQGSALAVVESGHREGSNDIEHSPSDLRTSTAAGIAGFIVEAHRLSSQSGEHPVVRPITHSVSVAVELIQQPFQAPIASQTVEEPQASIFSRPFVAFSELIT